MRMQKLPSTSLEHCVSHCRDDAAAPRLLLFILLAVFKLLAAIAVV
jgi:hypothetical protein